MYMAAKYYASVGYLKNRKFVAYSESGLKLIRNSHGAFRMIMLIIVANIN